jgi:hypothetical protein
MLERAEEQTGNTTLTAPLLHTLGLLLCSKKNAWNVQSSAADKNKPEAGGGGHPYRKRSESLISPQNRDARGLRAKC